MANIKKVKRNPVIVELDKERNLKYTLESFGELEDKYGSVESAFNALDGGKFRDIIFFIWCGLMSEDENITLKQVGKIVDIIDLPYLMERVKEAIEMDSPEMVNAQSPN